MSNIPEKVSLFSLSTLKIIKFAPAFFTLLLFLIYLFSFQIDRLFSLTFYAKNINTINILSLTETSSIPLLLSILTLLLYWLINLVDFLAPSIYLKTILIPFTYFECFVVNEVKQFLFATNNNQDKKRSLYYTTIKKITGQDGYSNIQEKLEGLLATASSNSYYFRVKDEYSNIMTLFRHFSYTLPISVYLVFVSQKPLVIFGSVTIILWLYYKVNSWIGLYHDYFQDIVAATYSEQLLKERRHHITALEDKNKLKINPCKDLVPKK